MAGGSEQDRFSMLWQIEPSWIESQRSDAEMVVRLS